ncbi:MAG: hypothetical protein LQ352_003713 [Teloschistes flavicans]|nr:MAG: hypothetical protein LQ352_003713 [Teloschistes flavicans]
MTGVLPASDPAYKAHNCTAWPEAQGDPDIAGIGVIVGFMLSAVLTLLVVIFHYVFDTQRVHENPVDRRFLNAIRSKEQESRIGSSPQDAWSAAMEASVLMFSDIQATTGLAVMLGAYSQLHRGLNAYHWQVAISLAWFSSLTHLATLSSLRGYFLDRPKIAIYRATYMGILLVLLIVAYSTTGYVQQSRADQSSSWPADCLFSGEDMDQVEYNDSDTNITWLVAALAWGILRLVGLRYKASLVSITGENTWTFGQTLPVILAVFPLCTIFTTFYNKKVEQRQDSVTAGTNPVVDDTESQTHNRLSRQDETIHNLDVSDRIWFPKLLGLMFGLALFLIGTCLFNFPAAPINKGGYWNTDKLADGYAMGTLLVQYIVLVGICGFEVVVFIATCLARGDSQRRPFMARKTMAWVLIVVMVASTLLFVWGFRRLLGLHHGDTFL